MPLKWQWQNFKARISSSSSRTIAGPLMADAQAAKQALAEGANAIIGPLLGPSVQAAGAVTRASGKPVIAFSTDSGVAGNGVYLLSFMPQSDVDRILDYAASKSKANIAALIPETAYGSVVNALLQDGAAKRGYRNSLAVERYSVSTVGEAAKRIANTRHSNGRPLYC